LAAAKDYLKKTVPLPAAYRRLSDGDDITIARARSASSPAPAIRRIR